MTRRFAPAVKPVPSMVSVCSEEERGIGLGLRDAMAGAGGGATTLKLAAGDDWPFGLVRVTLHARAEVPTATSARTCALLMNAIWLPLRVGSGPPGYVRLTLTPAADWKPLPLMVSTWLEVEPVIGFGLRLAMAGGGGGAVPCRVAANDARPFGLVTTILQTRETMPVTMETEISVPVRLTTGRRVAVPPA